MHSLKLELKLKQKVLSYMVVLVFMIWCRIIAYPLPDRNLLLWRKTLQRVGLKPQKQAVKCPIYFRLSILCKFRFLDLFWSI
jgi:hypothetical protein